MVEATPHAQVVSSVVQAVSASTIVALTVVIAIITGRYVHWTRKLFEATKDLVSQSVAQSEATNRMAESMTKLAAETARQARLMHLERYTKNLDRVLDYCADLLPSFKIQNTDETRMNALTAFRDVIIQQASAIPEPTRKYLFVAGRFTRALIEGLEAKSLTHGQLLFGVARLSGTTEDDIRAVMRGEDPPVCSLPDYDDAHEWIVTEAARLGAP